MNIICIKDKLREGVDLVGRVAGDHPTLAIVKNILIEADAEKIKLTATNLEVGMQYIVPGKVIEPGGITVPASFLGQLLGALTEDRVSLSVKDNVLEITTDTYQAKVQGTSAEEFPLIPKLENVDKYCEMNASVLREALESVIVATQFSELRPELNSLLFSFEQDHITLAATDSFRLAEKVLNDSEFTSTFEDDFKILVPLKTAQEAVRLLKKDGKARIVRDQNQILITTSEAEFISRLLEGTFPDYNAIIPKEFNAEITLQSAEFAGALKLASVFSGSLPEVTIRQSEKGKALEVFSRDEKLGENRSVISAKANGDFDEITFNWKYLMDGVKALDSKEFVLGVSDANRPAIMRAKDDSSYFYIVMPILKN